MKTHEPCPLPHICAFKEKFLMGSHGFGNSTDCFSMPLDPHRVIVSQNIIKLQNCRTKRICSLFRAYPHFSASLVASSSGGGGLILQAIETLYLDLAFVQPPTLIQLYTVQPYRHTVPGMLVVTPWRQVITAVCSVISNHELQPTQSQARK